MTDNKLFELINSLTAAERQECAVFLQSPYHNRREDVWKLWEWSQNHFGEKGRRTAESNRNVREQSGAPFGGPEALASIYPGQPYDDARWRHLQSYLTACIEAFLAQRAFEQTPLLGDLHLAAVYRQKGLRKPLEHTLRRAAERLEKMPRDQHYYRHLYELEWERYAATQSQARTRENNLAEVDRAFDVYLVAGKLRLACLMESHRAVFPVEYDNTLLSALLAALDASDLKKEPVVALYFHCYKALTEGNEADFRAFRQELEEQGGALPVDEVRTFLLLAINYCIRRLNTGEPHYVREAFDLYRIGLETRALLENGHLGRFAFKNIVALGLKLEEFAWVESFIGRFEPFLEEKYRAAHRNYNLARLYFARKDYRQAMPLLARVDESDLLLNLDSRVMLLKMYYETEEWDALDALLSSFRVLLLRKKKVIGYHSANYLATLRFVQKLARLNFEDKKAVASFRVETEAKKGLLEKEWLLKMVAR